MPSEFRTTFFSIVLVPSLFLFSSCNRNYGTFTPGLVPATTTLAFNPPTVTPTGGVDGRGIVVADVDRDGFADVLVRNETLANVSLLRGQVDARLANGSSVPAQALVAAAVLGDVTGDRLVDLVSASGASASLTVARGRGDGTFDAATAIAVPWPVRKLVIVDWNADGRADLIAASAIFPELAVLRGTGAGNFAAPIVASTPYLVADFAVADFDGDQRLDLVLSGLGWPRLDVLRNDGVGGFLPLATTATSSRGGSLACCDLNGDRRPDLVSVDGALGTVTAFLGDGSSGFAAGVTRGISAASIDSLTLGDLDGDGRIDLIVAAGSQVFAAYGDGLGAFGAAELLRSEGTTIRSVIARDLRSNGMVDVLYVLGGNSVAVLRNPRSSATGLATFGEGTPDCGGRIGMSTSGRPVLGNAGFGYVATNAPINAVGLLLQGGPADVPGSDPLGVGVRIHLGFGLLVSRLIFSDQIGMAVVPDALPADPGLAGLPIHVQTLWLSNLATTCSVSSAGFVSSRGLTVTLQL